MSKVCVDVEDIVDASETITDFNKLDLENVVLFEDGKPVVVPEGAIERFRLTGLANKDFVLTGIYKTGMDQ